jgi:hypothetical protein
MTKDEIAFIFAKSSPRMKEVHIPEIIQVLNKGMLLLGIKGEKLPSEFEYQVLTTELRTQYAGLALKELDLAFTLAARDVLDFNAETYQAMTVFYLNKMLSSYLRWAAQKQFVDRILDEPKQPEFDKVEEDEIIRISFESFKKFKKWNAIFNTLGTFRILIERDLIDMTEKSREEIVKLTEQATRQLAQEVEYEDRQEILNELEDDDAMELNCKRMAVAQYFNKIMRDERNKR